MNTTDIRPEVTNTLKRSWRRHSDEFKARVVELARQPHASLASVALANGINANMLRRWVQGPSPTSAPSATRRDIGSSQALAFVQLPIQGEKPTLERPASTSVIEVQIHRGETRVVVCLPLGVGSAAWVREVLG